MVDKLKVGSVVRLTSFANKPADGSDPKGFSASPEGTPEEERNVFVCMILGVEPQFMEQDEGHTQEFVAEALHRMGYAKIDRKDIPFTVPVIRH